MIQLTDKQKEFLLKLGGSSSFEMVPSDVWDELLALGLMYKRSDGRFDLTETGEQIYNQLALKRK
jgi:hypothetical protein